MSSTPLPRYRRPEVLDDLPATGHHVIEASAGTGKTFTIEHLVVERVLGGCDLAKLLVVTFTERAAAELRTRIRTLLWRLRVAAEAAPTHETFDSQWTLDDTAKKRLDDALLKMDGAAISTIHSFCQRLLTENAFAHQRLFSQRLTDGRELFSEVFRDLLRTELATDLDLQPVLRAALPPGGYEEDGALEQLEKLLYDVASFHGRLEPVLDHAAISATLATLPARLPSPEAIATAFANKGSTAKILRTAGVALDALQTARAAGRATRLAALAELNEVDGDDTIAAYVAGKLGHEKVASLPGAAAVAAAVTSLAASVPGRKALLAHLVTPRLKELVREKKEAQGLYDFSDMLELVDQSLAGPNAAGIIEALRVRYEHVLIDEFQDTDPVQWRVFQRLFAGADSPSRLTVIGDPKQAIYGFRAADVATYLEAREALCGEQDLAKLEAQIVRLTENYRSSARMIAAYNQVLTQTPARGDPFFATDPRITYGARAAVSCGDATVRLTDAAGVELPPVRVLRGLVTGGKGRPALVRPLARFIADEVSRLIAPGGPVLFDKRHPAGRPLHAGDVYVLFRARGEGALVAEALAARGLPHAFYKLDGLFETPEVADLLDVLDAVASPGDGLKRLRAWLTPFFGLTPADAERALEVADDHPLARRLSSWTELAAKRDMPRFFAALVEESGLSRRAAFLPTGERPLANTLRALELLAEEARRRQATLGELVELLRGWRNGTSKPAQQDADTQPLETERAAVQLMTMHAAKGLEAPVVFLCGGTGSLPGGELSRYRDDSGRRCGWVGRLPDEVKARVEREEAGEDERLVYVALTRAKVRLYAPLYVQAVEAAHPPGSPEAGPAALKGQHLRSPRAQSRGRTALTPVSPPPVGAADSDPRRPHAGVEADSTAAPHGPAELTGSLAGLNTRLFHVLAEGAAPALFEVTPLDMSPPEPLAPDRAGLAAWQPAVALANAGDTLSHERHALARARKGGLVTSYSQLARSEKVVPVEVEKEEATGETNRAETKKDELVTSNVVGNFLHDALEALDLAKVRGFAGAAEFAKDAEVRALVERGADAAGIAREQRGHAYRLLWAALRTPLALGDARLPCVAEATKVVRETEFLFPIPERGQALWSGGGAAGGEAPFSIHRGCVKGFIDVLFEWEGKVYFGDWKSSVLKDASPAALERYVDAHFQWQVAVYGVAVLRLLGVTDEAGYRKRFGGFLYLFLRDMEDTPAGDAARGVWFARPGWAQVKAWETKLLEHGYGWEGGA